MPASGKSTIGRHLAAELELEFVDLDQIIVEKEGCEITDIFRDKGEAYFREVERLYLLELLKTDNGYVLATGGGAPCFFDNMQQMNDHGTTIFLDISVQNLFNKLSKKGTHKRPLLKNVSQEDLYAELDAKYRERKHFFEQADITLQQELGQVPERVKQVREAIKALEEDSKR